MRMPNIETESQVRQPRIDYELAQVRGCGQFSRRIFQRQRDAAFFCKNVQVLERAESRVESPRIRGVPRRADVLHEVAEGHIFCDIQGPLDFVHGFQATHSFRIADGKWRAAFVHAVEVALRGGVEGVQCQVMIAQRAGNFAHGIEGVVVEVRPRAKYF